jgi:hypothetical protein
MCSRAVSGSSQAKKHNPSNTMATYSVYYMRSDFFADGIRGYDWLKQKNRVPDVSDLSASHVYLMDIEADTMEDVYFKMQGESWSSTGEARKLILFKGLRHTSMAVGDIVIDQDSRFVYVVDRTGFKFLGKVPTVGEA